MKAKETYKFKAEDFVPFEFTEAMIMNGIDPIEVMTECVKGEGQIGEALVHVTKELAQKWLDNGNYNRSINQTVVNKRAKDMEAGMWILLNHGIGFDRDGMLMDGQHTLTAFMVSELTSIKLMVTTNIDKSAMWSCIDVIKKNIAHQIEGLEERVVNRIEPTILVGAFINSLARLGTFTVLTLGIYQDKMDKCNHRKSMEWVMNLIETKLPKDKKTALLYSNVLRAHDSIVNSDSNEAEKAKQLTRLERFCQICQGVEAELGAKEEWAFKMYLYLHNEHMKDNRSSRGGGKNEAQGGGAPRKMLYLKINRMLHAHMTYAPFQPTAIVRMAITEHFPFPEELAGMTKRIANKKSQRNEAALKKATKDAITARKKAMAQLNTKGITPSDLDEIIKGITPEKKLQEPELSKEPELA